MNCSGIVSTHKVCFQLKLAKGYLSALRKSWLILVCCRENNKTWTTNIAKEMFGHSCWFQRKNNCESCLEKVVSMHRIGCFFVGRVFLGSPKKATTYHPPELGYLEQELLLLAVDLIEKRRCLKSLKPELFVHNLERFGRV